MKIRMIYVFESERTRSLGIPKLACRGNQIPNYRRARELVSEIDLSREIYQHINNSGYKSDTSK